MPQLLPTPQIWATARTLQIEGARNGDDKKSLVGTSLPSSRPATTSVRQLIDGVARSSDLVVEATQAEVAALKAHEGVCGVARSHQVIHRPDAGRRLDVDALRRNNEWWGKSHNQGKPWNLDRVNGQLDGNDNFEVSSKGTNVFVLDTGLDTLHQEFDGDREVENVGSY